MTTHDQQPGETRRSGRVRIIGAEPAGGPAPEDGEQAPAGAHEPEDAGGAPTGTELPHWTEAPTGEVPAVLARDPEEGASEGADPWSTLPAPTWREEHADWTADEGTFEPSMLAHNEARLGSLDDSGESDRQPWSFELPGHDPEQDTMVVPVVGRPLAAEEPGEVAFRFDEVDGVRPATGIGRFAIQKRVVHEVDWCL